MDTLEVFTIGNAYFLDKIFNAIRLIFSSGFTGILKVAVSISLGLLAIKACMTSNFKETAKWMIGVVVLTGFFLNTKAKIIIHDQLPDSYGRIQAPYIVEDVPWGLGWIAHLTSNVGRVVMNKFEVAFSGVTNNQTYAKYGILFGSKIIEDASRIRISNADLRVNMVKFYRQCMVPDLKMGHARRNGYTFKELASAEDIGEFLKTHASRARNIYLSGTVTKREKKPGIWGSVLGSVSESTSTIDGYVSCNKAAHHICDMIEEEIQRNKHLISSSFTAQFMGDNVQAEAKNKFFDTVLTDTYGAFLKSSKDASEILKQNIMINAVTDSARSVANSYARTATDEMTRSSMYSVSQIFQKFIPIIRSVFECLFYGIAPLVLILMVTPIGLEVLKNYAFSFLYLQMWPPMYAILFVITESWSRFSSSGLKHNMESLPQIEAINYDISMVSGYMLALIPIIAMFATKGLVASVGNMASSMLYIPQAASVATSDQAVKGNFSIGNSSLDMHSYDNLSAHKYDDNYSWMSGMKNFQQQTGSIMKEDARGYRVMDLSSSSHNLAGRVNVSWNQAVGSRLDSSETTAHREMEIAGKDHVNSLSTGMSKLLGYDSTYSKGTSAYEMISKSMTHDEREAVDYVRGITDRVSKASGISSTDVLRMTASAKGGIEALGNSVSFEIAGSSESQKQQAWNQIKDATKEERFVKSLSLVEAFGKTNNIQTNDSELQSTVNSVKSDFNQASSASSRLSQAREQLHSIQEMRGNYENNGHNIDLNLNNKFADWGIKKYGAEGFERVLTSNPEIAQEAVQAFLKEEIRGVAKHNFVGLSNKNLSLSSDDYSNLISKHNYNKDLANEESEAFISKSELSKSNLRGQYQSSNTGFEKHNNQRQQQVREHKQKVNLKGNNREIQGKQKIDQLASQQFGDRILKTFTQEDKK